jgi:hypothetical protein
MIKNPSFELLSLAEIRAAADPARLRLAETLPLVRGTITVIAGPAGAGKTRLADALAFAGATATSWLGHHVPKRFSTMFVQTRRALGTVADHFSEFGEGAGDLERHVFTTPPLVRGFSGAGCPDDRAPDLRDALKRSGADLVVFDRWDDLVAQHGVALLETIHRALPANRAKAPAVVIVADAKKTPLGGMTPARVAQVAHHVLHVLPVPSRSGEDRIVVTTLKNLYGDAGAASAWHRCNGRFQVCETFDWKLFHQLQ